MLKKIILAIVCLHGATNLTIAMDRGERTPLVHHNDADFEAIVIEDGYTLQQAYNTQKLRSNTQGYLIHIDKNLTSFDGLSVLQDKLHFSSITHLNFSRNKLTNVPAELFSLLTNVTIMNLADNEIETICDPIPPHQHLVTLMLHNNKLKTFPLQQLLHNTPVKKLTLHNNAITDGSLNTPCTSLKELWLDDDTSLRTKQMIAQYCTHLNAEICEGDSTIQNAYTTVEYSQKCRKECAKNTSLGAIISGVSGFIGGVLFAVPCIYVKTCNNAVYDSLPNGGVLILLFGGLGAGAIVGSLVGLSRALCCTVKPDERYTITILKKIDQYPPIILKLKQQELDKALEQSTT